MNDKVINGVLFGLAVGGLTAAVIEINKTALQTLWWFNCLVAELVGDLVTPDWSNRKTTTPVKKQ